MLEKFFRYIKDQLYLLQLSCNPFNLKKRNSKKACFISHDASLSGAPIVLMRAATAIRTLGYDVEMILPTKGLLEKELEKKDIKYKILNVRSNPPLSKLYLKDFELIFINTVVNADIVNFIPRGSKVIWWIHEAKEVYLIPDVTKNMPQKVNRNVKIFCGGDYAKKMLMEVRPQYIAGNLNYFTEDCLPYLKPKEDTEYLTFTCVGTIEFRKGQDILVEAIKILPEKYLKKAKFTFVGRNASEEITQSIYHLKNIYPDIINIYSTVSYNELREIYNTMDVLVSVSRDDPMPVVVADAMSMRKIILIGSSNGYASIVTKEDAGFIFENDNFESLAKKICFIIDKYNSFDVKRNNAREAYLKYFTENVFLTNVTSIIK